MSTENFVVFCDFEHSKFLNSFSTFFSNRTTGKRKHGFTVKKHGFTVKKQVATLLNVVFI